MPTDLKSLLDGETEDTVLTFLLTELNSLGIKTLSWYSGSVVFTILKAFARLGADLSLSLAAITRGGLLGLSTGDWLSALAAWYALERNAATFARGTIRLTVLSGFGPYTVAPSQLVAVEALRQQRYLSSNASNVTLPAGPSTTDVPFVAEATGASYNVPVGTGLSLATPLPGVTPAFPDLGNGTWLTTPGADEEGDDALTTRCRTRWATVGLLKTHDAYVFLAMNVAGVATPPTKVGVDDQNPRGPGTLDIWLATNSGPLGAADVALINTYLQTLKAPATDLLVSAAVGFGVTVAATVTYLAAYQDTLATIEGAIAAYLGALPIGGKVLRAKVVDAILSAPGFVNTDVNAILVAGSAGDHQLGPSEVALVGTLTITLVPA